MDEKLCANCLFFVENNSVSGGECRRYPPQRIGETWSHAHSDFPDVSKNKWCGEWEPKISLPVVKERKK